MTSHENISQLHFGKEIQYLFDNESFKKMLDMSRPFHRKSNISIFSIVLLYHLENRWLATSQVLVKIMASYKSPTKLGVALQHRSFLHSVVSSLVTVHLPGSFNLTYLNGLYIVGGSAKPMNETYATVKIESFLLGSG